MKIKIFTTPTWAYCHQLKEFLSEKGLTYEEFDVARDPQALDEMVRISGKRAIPTTLIDNDVIIGFDQEKIEKRISRK